MTITLNDSDLQKLDDIIGELPFKHGKIIFSFFQEKIKEEAIKQAEIKRLTNEFSGNSTQGGTESFGNQTS